jgi:hypothetical protein
MVGALALVYTASLVFDPARVNRRNAAYSWLNERNIARVDAIELKSADGNLTLERKNGAWFALSDGKEYLAKTRRVEDFLKLLAKKDAYPVRGTEAASMERLGLSDDGADRVTARGGGSVFLDLLVGASDASGGVYLRAAGADEARSGSSAIAGYVAGEKTAWYDLRLFPAEWNLSPALVQRITVNPPADSGQDGAPAPLVLARADGAWTVNGAAADTSAVESYARALLDTEAADFAASGGVLNAGSIAVDFGDGTSRVISVGAKAEAGGREAAVSGSPYTYSLADWAANRLFKPESEFKKP